MQLYRFRRLRASCFCRVVANQNWKHSLWSSMLSYCCWLSCSFVLKYPWLSWRFAFVALTRLNPVDYRDQHVLDCNVKQETRTLTNMTPLKIVQLCFEQIFGLVVEPESCSSFFRHFRVLERRRNWNFAVLVKIRSNDPPTLTDVRHTAVFRLPSFFTNSNHTNDSYILFIKYIQMCDHLKTFWRYIFQQASIYNCNIMYNCIMNHLFNSHEINKKFTKIIPVELVWNNWGNISLCVSN